ncbi:MAG: YgiQ family radical SAM protein [Porphyromonadaceae bacterium]|nr:YgiQ family radical SAM protein [Porphyromonadaceae bacterium]
MSVPTLEIERWLPTSRKELERRGWEWVDVILFSGDAYVDHPSFGASVIGRVLEAEGLRVALVPHPNWRDDLRDFKKLGRPRLFFGVSAGAMDSMVNHYTANKRLRSDDAYTPDGRPGMRPDYPTIVYTRILKELYPDVPVVIGGIEASLRRITHYDYWQDCLRPSILIESGADILSYGMGEQTLREIARRLRDGEPVSALCDIPQTVVVRPVADMPAEKEGENYCVLAPHEVCLKSRRAQARNFAVVEEESNRYAARLLWQQCGEKALKINPPWPPISEAELDAIYDLPFTRLPHPRYQGKTIPAFEMIKFSITLHRGCFGGCAFCTLSAHQGKFISSRSEASVLREVKQIVAMPDFKGNLSDLGGPSANMYRMNGKKLSACRACRRPSCLWPAVCPNLHIDHRPLLHLYRAVDRMPGVKRSFIGSGIRYDLLLPRNAEEALNAASREYIEELITRHVSGRLKVAPEHVSREVLGCMRKPDFKQFEQFRTIFERINEVHGLRQQLIPYFMSSHPGCRPVDMAELATITKNLNFLLEQVQDFTPTPMTLATETYYAGFNPCTGERVYTARTAEEKLAQRQFFFWYKPEFRRGIEQELRRMRREDLLVKLFGNRYSTPPSPKRSKRSKR